ncbi:MAG: dTMP kinase [Treponema sp.]|nr:dTMP kinase [Treponema sp.]
MEILKNFVVFEGCDGSGTTTQLNTIENFFLDNKPSLPSFFKTFEPTKGSIGKLIRLGLRNEEILTPQTIAMLFAADRNEHLYAKDGLVERCQRGELVVCDRYVPSSLVYQGITCGDELPERLNKDFPGPELLLFFDIESEEALRRLSSRDRKEIYEYLDFQVEVRRRYKALLPKLQESGVRVEIIDASLPPDEVAKKVWAVLREMPIFKG